MTGAEHVYTDGGWKSVLARGHLEELSESSSDSAAVQAVRNLKIPYYQVFAEGADKLDLTIVSIDVRKLTGIVSGGAEQA